MLNRVITALIVGLVLLSEGAWGRVVTGVIRVVDRDGEPVPGVRVTGSSSEPGKSFEETTDPKGQIRVLQGSYQIEMRIPGFSPVRRFLEVVPSQTRRIVISTVTPTWNSWAVPEQGGEATSEMVAGSAYSVTFDLAGVDYGEFVDQSSVATKVDPILADLLQKRTRVTLLIKPFIQGEGLRLIEAKEDRNIAQRLSVDLERLRNTSEILESMLPSDRSNLVTLSEALHALRISVLVEADKIGPAEVGLAVWDAETRQPLDFVIFKAAVRSRPSTGSPPLFPLIQPDTGRRHLVGFSNTPVANATLTIRESGSAVDGSLSNTVAFLGRDDFTRIWSPRRSIREFVSLDGQFGLVRQLQLVHCDEDFAQVSRFFSGVLFSDPKEEGWKNAKEAQSELGAIIEIYRKPVIATDFRDAAGQSLPLPLGMLGIERPAEEEATQPGSTKIMALGELATITQPLQQQHEEATGACINVFTTILPTSLGLGDGCECKDLDDLLKPDVPPSDPHLQDFELVKQYFASNAEAEREALLMISHHADGFVSFQPSFSDAMQAEEITRRYKPGSAAILISCTVGSLTPLNRSLPFIRTLNEKGVSAMIFSPFTINATLGSRLAVHFADQIEKARENHEPITLLELFQRVRKSIRKDEHAEPFLGELNGISLAGSGNVRLCPDTTFAPQSLAPPDDQERCHCSLWTRMTSRLKSSVVNTLGGPWEQSTPSAPPKSGVGAAERAAARRCREAAAQGQSPCSSKPAQ